MGFGAYDLGLGVSSLWFKGCLACGVQGYGSTDVASIFLSIIPILPQYSPIIPI